MKNIVHGGDIYSHQGRQVLDFSANINPLGLPESVKRAITENMSAFEHYPDPLCRELKAAISEGHQIGEDNIVCGNGAADLIYRIALYLKPFRAIVPVPTFSEYERALELVECNTSHFPLSEDNGFVIAQGLLERITSREDILFICNPNNPTGVLSDKKYMLALAAKCRENGVVLMVDECFMDFVADSEQYSIANYVGLMPNVIVLKAFTKLYAMAGIRLGYAICGDAEVALGVSEMLQPWSVSAVASKCGLAALGEEDYVARTKILTAENRAFLMNSLKEYGLKTFDSRANFILFAFDGPDLTEPFRNEGILIRPCANFAGLSNRFYRIAVRSRQENELFCEALKKIMGRIQSEGSN